MVHSLSPLLSAAALAWLTVCSLLIAAPVPASAESRVCSATAQLQFKACRAEARSDLQTTKAFCLNEDAGPRGCRRDAAEAHDEARNLCSDQLAARRNLCGTIGEAPYQPDMDPDHFQDPRNPWNPNPYFPLAVGNRWVFEEDGERIEIEVLDATKRISGIDCVVYRDTVTSDGLLVEDTDDWFGIRHNADVVYCGEEVKDYEYFEGDDPESPELTSIDGRFKVGVDLAKSGITFLGTPSVGITYRQEWDPGNAEDIGSVLSTTYGYGSDPVLDAFVPEALANLMCPDHDCIVIADQSTLDPDSFEHKFYARGIGKFLEVKPDEGEFVPLAECNFDPRCDALPIE